MHLTRVEQFPDIRVVAREIAPAADIAARIERKWEAEKARNGDRVFNGQVLAGKYQNGAIEAFVTQYKYWMSGELDLVGLAVTGILQCRDGILLGRRQMHMRQSPGQWEFMPSGAIDLHAVTGETVDIKRQLMLELTEETGLEAGVITAVRPFGLIEDEKDHVLDFVAVMVADCGGDAMRAAFMAGQRDEHSEIAVVAPGDIEDFIGRYPGQIAESTLLGLREICDDRAGDKSCARSV